MEPLWPFKLSSLLPSVAGWVTHRGSGNQESNERKFVQDNDSDDEEGDGEDYQCGNDEVRFIIIGDTNIIKVIIIVIIIRWNTN